MSSYVGAACANYGALAAAVALTVRPMIEYTDAPPQDVPEGPAPSVRASAPKAGFSMREVKALPPIYEEIAQVFPAVKRRRGVVFAWGNVLYNPHGVVIPPALMAHEQAHGVRQLEIGVERWWARYLDDREFRFAEELIGHRAEYLARIIDAPHRNARRWHLRQTAERLSGTLYSLGITRDEAARAIKAPHATGA